VQFPPMRHDWQHHNLGFGLWVQLLLVSSASRYTQITNMIENIRSYNFAFWVWVSRGGP
jgi:hypothetical protein